MVSQLILLPNVAAHYCWHVWDHESVCIEVRVSINRIWEKMSLTTFALPRDYVVFLSSGVSLTVKCPQGKSPQAGGRRGRWYLRNVCFRLGLEIIHLLKVCVSTVNFTRFIQSWILEKVLKFAKQFSRPGKCLENRDKVWNNGKQSEQQKLKKWICSPLVKSGSQPRHSIT